MDIQADAICIRLMHGWKDMSVAPFWSWQDAHVRQRRFDALSICDRLHFAGGQSIGHTLQNSIVSSVRACSAHACEAPLALTGRPGQARASSDMVVIELSILQMLVSPPQWTPTMLPWNET